MIRWNGDNYVRDVERNLSQRMRALGFAGITEIRAMISISGRTISHKMITRGKNKGQQKKVLGAYGSDPSKPGEPPHKQHGKLRQSIASDFDAERFILRIGTPLSYGKFLELGTSRMARRPYLSRWLHENKQRIKDDLAKATGGKTT